MKIIFWISAFVIFYTMIGFPITLMILGKIIKRKNKKDYSYKPKVTMMIAAYNEEKVIEQKLENAMLSDYDDLEILIANDCSSDRTVEICERFIKNHPEMDIKISTAKDHFGKTNAQNEAVEKASGEIIVFSDANSMYKPNAISELVSYFTSDDIEYVCGALVYVKDDNVSSVVAENAYWDLELKMRKIESDIKTITAGNGAIYAVRKKDYKIYNIAASHDYEMPLHAGLDKKRAIFNPDAIASEKAGATTKDEFKRKVRMQERILTYLFTNLRRLNIFEYGWFSFFHFNHKTLRFLQGFFHVLLFVSNIFLLKAGFIYRLIFVGQILFFLLAFIGQVTKSKNKILFFPLYYSMMMLAQIMGAYREATGKSKPTWDKAESTR